MNIEKLIVKAGDALLRGDYEKALDNSEKAHKHLDSCDYNENPQVITAIERLAELARAAQSGLAEARDSIQKLMAEAGDLRLYDTGGKESRENVARRKNIKFLIII